MRFSWLKRIFKYHFFRIYKINEHIWNPFSSTNAVKNLSSMTLNIAI